MLTKREQALDAEQQKRFWEIVRDVPRMALQEIEVRRAAGYNEVGYWRTYPFPHGVSTLLTMKHVRVKSMTESERPAAELLKDDVLLDNVIDLMNYSWLLAATMLFLREEGVEP